MAGRQPRHGRDGPQPDLIVIDHKVTALDSVPVLAIEILSPSDGRPLERSPLTRIEGKRLDYAGQGLTDYLEIDLSGRAPTVTRFELHDGDLTEVARNSGSSALLAGRPFSYYLVPDDLVR
jgi:Uma2 family endonuclease